MRLLRKYIENKTKKGTVRILNPKGKVNGLITMTTDPKNYYNSYIVDREQIEITESGGIVSKLPKKSNIRQIEPELNEIGKRWGGVKASYRGSQPRLLQESWVDGSNRYFATKTETRDGIAYDLRCDIANELNQKGKYLVQCDESFCDILLVNNLQCNLDKYTVAQNDEEDFSLYK